MQGKEKKQIHRISNFWAVYIFLISVVYLTRLFFDYPGTWFPLTKKRYVLERTSQSSFWFTAQVLMFINIFIKPGVYLEHQIFLDFNVILIFAFSNVFQIHVS